MAVSMSVWLLAVLLPLANAAPTSKTTMTYSTEASWDFSHGLEGWGNATAEEMHCELYHRGGEIRGSIRNTIPHLDSPRMMIQAVDRHYVVVRMMYHGTATKGRVVIRDGATMPTLHDIGNHLPFETSKIDFLVNGNGQFKTYYVPLWHYFHGQLTQLRLHPAVGVIEDVANGVAGSPSPQLGHTFAIDWVKISKGTVHTHTFD